MRTGMLRLAFAMIAAIGLSACSDHSSPASLTTSTPTGGLTINMPEASATVVVKDRAFNPADVTIKAGQLVEWRFDDNGTAHSLKGLFSDTSTTEGTQPGRRT